MRLPVVALLVGLAVAVDGCSSASSARPAVACSLDNYECTAHKAVAVGTGLRYGVSWQTTCKSAVTLPDTSSDVECDPQPFTAKIVCTGATCESDPPEAVGGGASISGQKWITVRPLTAGDLTVKVELEHQETHEIFVNDTTTIKVRQPDRLALDAVCRTSDFVWHPCQPNEKFFGLFEFSIWVYGQAGTDSVYMSKPSVQFDGASPNHFEMSGGSVHPDPGAQGDADSWSGSIEPDHTMNVRATAGPLTASMSVHVESVPPLAGPFNIVGISQDALRWESSAGALSYQASISKADAAGNCTTEGTFSMGGLTGVSVGLASLTGLPRGNVCVTMKAMDEHQNGRDATNEPFKGVL